MPLFNKKPFSYDIIREGENIILQINCETYTKVPSLEDDPLTMSKTIDILNEAGTVTKIVYFQRRNIEYDYSQTILLKEIADLYKKLLRQKEILSYNALVYDKTCTKCVAKWYADIRNIVSNMLRSDPIGAYVELKRILRDENIKEQKATDTRCKNCEKKYISLLNYLIGLLEKTQLIAIAKPHLAGYKVGSRDLYRMIFKPLIKPDFLFTKLMSKFPEEGEELDSYMVDNTEITIFKLPDTIQYLYHINPPEFRLSEDKYEILDQARKIMTEHKPKRSEFVDPERMRSVFYNIGHDLIEELIEFKKIRLSDKDIDELTNILVRYTVGFGLIEVLLQDEKIQDITINSPMGEIPMFIVHEEFGDCKTNIIPTRTEADSWASKLRMISGRPLDEANPILDTELIIPGVRSRVAVITAPLDPTGLAYAFRRHRDKPWTLPLFIHNRMLNPLGAGILSFLIDGSRTMLVAGTRSAGKTSILGALLTEIMRKYRIITIEDSVTADSNIVIKKHGKLKRTTIGSLTDTLIEKYGCWYELTEHEVLGNPEDIEVFAMDKQGKIKLSRVTKFIRHKVHKAIYEITTRTGRRIKVTGDHSLFNIGEDGSIKEAKVRNLKKADYIAVPRIIPWFNTEMREYDIFEKVIKLNNSYLIGNSIKNFINKYKFEVKRLAKEHNYAKSTTDFWFAKGIVPGKILEDMFCLDYNIQDKENINYKISKNSQLSLPTKINMDKDFLIFIGLWIADGCYDKNSVIVSSVDKEDRAVIRKIAKRFSMNIKLHSDGFSLMLNSKTLKTLMRDILELKGDSYTRRIPGWVFNLSKKQIGYLLNGIFTGDGCPTGKEIVIPMASINLLKDIQFLLSTFGIIFRIGSKRDDKTYNASISSLKSWLKYQKHIGFLQKYKQKKLSRLCNKISTHDTTDIVPLSINTKKELINMVKGLNSNDYLRRNNNIGRSKSSSCLQTLSINNELLENLKILLSSDIFWDQIREIKVYNNDSYVYDISVPECESFVCENIIAHNTLELPVESLRKLGYNVQQMKVAAAMTKGTAEVSAEEGIRTTLRMGDSCLIVGEVRSVESRSLYEAMRVGALANVVAGTIHGDSPYGVFDRVVNDLGVQRTSFKATDIILVANPIRSADGLHRWRRVTQITEVRKHWEQDPLLENGFSDLMKYDSKSDELQPSDDVINGDSEILKSIAGSVKEWAGNWDAVWDNIQLRAKIKETIVNFSVKQKDLSLLEAPFVIQCNDEFHKISDKVKEEIGVLDSKKIFFEWNEWLKRMVKKKRIK